MTGFVYILTNKAMPGLLKIGHTKLQLHERIMQLNGTGVPVGFEIGAVFAVKEPAQVERSIHVALTSFRYNQKREFFALSLSEAISKSMAYVHPNLLDESDVGLESPQAVASCFIEPETIVVLQNLAYLKKEGGTMIRHLCDITKESELQVENRLAQLAEKKLVQEQSTRGAWGGNLWIISSRGVKYLFDNDLIEDQMLDDRW